MLVKQQQKTLPHELFLWRCEQQLYDVTVASITFLPSDSNQMGKKRPQFYPKIAPCEILPLALLFRMFSCCQVMRWKDDSSSAGLIALVRFVSAIPFRCLTSILVIQIWWNIFLLEGINSRWLPRCRFSVHIFIS